MIPRFSNRGVLVTGGAGFIGSHLVDALLAQGARVRVMDSFATGDARNLAHSRSAIDLVEGDIRDAALVRRACEGVAYVFHQAALGSVPRSLADPATTIDVNVAGTANVFAGARDAKVRRVVYASSSSVYGDSEALPKREGSEGRPLSPYAASKRMNEELAEVFGRNFAMELIGLRYFNVFGPRQSPEGPYAAVVPRFFKACLAGESPVIYGDGLQSRDFTYVADAVAANLLAAGAPAEAAGCAYNVAGGRRTTILDVAKAIRSIVGVDAEPRFEAPRPGDVKHSHADLSRARAALGYEPGVELGTGLARCRGDYVGDAGSDSMEGASR